MPYRTLVILSLTSVISILTVPASPNQQNDYVSNIEAWRLEREQSLKADDGWLTVEGLFFLREGDNAFGASPLNDIVLPTGPAEAGIFALRNQKVTVQAAGRQTLTVDGAQVTSTTLYPSENRVDITIGDLTLFVHHSGSRLAIRMRNTNSAIRQAFTRLQWYPVKETYRVPARFIPHDKPIAVNVQNILGDIETLTSYGSVKLTLDGESLEMLSVDSDGQLWFIFRDLTSGTETYGAARFLYADAPENGWTTVDFNKAYNPPCAFNPHTTCPLPPKQNRLQLRIEAGERNYKQRP